MNARLNALPFPVLVIVFCLLWSLAFAVGRIGLAYAPPMTLLALRFLIAAAFALALARLGGEEWPRGRTLAALAAVGLVNHALYLGLSYVGMGKVPSGLTAVVVSANPILTAILAALVLDERLSPRKVVGLGLGVAGVLFILRHRVVSGVDEAAQLAWPLGALAALSGGAILYKRVAAPGGAGGFAGLAVQLAAAGLAMAGPAWAMEGGLAAIRPEPAFWASLAFQSVAASLGVYWIWFRLLHLSSATAASAWHFLMPPLGLLFGWMLLNEQVSWADLAGIAPVAAGIALVTRAPRRA